MAAPGPREEAFPLDLGGSLAVAVLDSIPSLVVVLDRVGRIVRCNRAFERVTGATGAEVRGRVVWDLFVVPEEIEAVRAAFINLLADRTGSQQRASQHENQWRTRDGQLRRISWSDTAILDAAGEVEYVVGTGTDVTERHWAEEDLLRTNQALRALVEASPLAILVIDGDAVVRVWSPAAERIFGWSRREVLGRVLPIFPAEREAERERNIRATFEGRPLSGIETVRRRKDGSLVDVAIWTSLLRGPQDEPESILAVVADIGDRKRAEAALRLHAEEVQAASQAKDRFLAVLSHELRTPLTPVLAAVSTLEAGLGLSSGLRESLAMIRRNVELEARLIDDLLDLTRISCGKLVLHCQAVDAWEILQHAIHICCTREVAAGRLRLDLGLTPGDYRVWADGPRLTQVFWNLLNNAVKFTPEGGTITVRSFFEDGAGRHVAVEISDTGIGIEPEMLPRVFDAFEQADRHITRRFGGLGLGLAVTKAIVELHGGSLTASSAGCGHGATFTVRLPQGEPQLDLDDTMSALPAPFAASLSAAEQALRILLVEDHADTAAAMADLLEMIGHRVTVASNVAAGLAAAAAAGAEGGFDLLLSDIGLPDGSGLDLMRELARLYSLPGIALSGYGMEDDLRKSREAGFSLHLTKPVSLQALKAALLQLSTLRRGGGR
jgi:two-component system CheB/CheR fusion protein